LQVLETDAKNQKLKENLDQMMKVLAGSTEGVQII